MKIFERFGDKGYHTTIVTTFAIDFDAWEQIALARLRGSNCTNNILIADDRMLTHALDGTAALPSAAGRQYLVFGAKPKGVFHPKIILQLGRKSGRLIVASANMTSSGISGNLEIAGEIIFDGDGEGERNLISAAWNYLSDLVPKERGILLDQINWAKARTRWLEENIPKASTQKLSDGTHAGFLVNGVDSKIGNDFIRMIGEGPVDTMLVISPYWDDKLLALKSLKARLKPRRTILLLDVDRGLFPATALDSEDDVEIFNIGQLPFSKQRFVHAKSIIVQTAEADHVLFGSPNCTIAAMGMNSFGGDNQEAALYRQLPPNTILQSLGLSDHIHPDNRVPAKTLPPQSKNEEIPLDQSALRNPGVFECMYNTLTWIPSRVMVFSEIRIELLDVAGSPISSPLGVNDSQESGSVKIRLPVLNSRPSFARLCYPDGTRSAPAIVTLLDVVKGAIKEASGRRVENLWKQLDPDMEEDLILLDLVDQIETATNENPDGVELAKAGSRNRSTKSERGEQSFRKLGYEDFLAERRPELEKSGIPRLVDAASDINLVRGFLNRLLGVDGAKSNSTDESHEASLRQALTVTAEDYSDLDHNFDQADSSKKVTESLLTESEQKKKSRQHKLQKDAEKQKQLESAVEQFHERINTNRSASRPFGLSDVLRLRILLMVIAASGCGADIINGVNEQPGKRTALQVLPVRGDKSWPTLMGQLLFAFFGGMSPAINLLEIGREHDQIPDDLLECWATCYWAVLLCLNTANRIPNDPRVNSFAKIVERIYKLTGLRNDELLSLPVTSIIEALNKRFSKRLEFNGDEIKREHFRRGSFFKHME